MLLEKMSEVDVHTSSADREINATEHVSFAMTFSVGINASLAVYAIPANLSVVNKSALAQFDYRPPMQLFNLEGGALAWSNKTHGYK